MSISSQKILDLVKPSIIYTPLKSSDRIGLHSFCNSSEMSSESSDMETSFDSDDSEINFIAGYELEDEGHSCRVSPRSPETSSDSSDDDAAYTDEQLADAEWIENTKKK